MTLVDINFSFPKMRERFKKNSDRIAMLIAATLQTQRRMIFDSEGKYNGRRGWVPLAIRYGQPLLDKGTLARSIGPSNDGKTPGRSQGSVVRMSGDTVTIGTSLKYARLQNNGGVIRPKNKSVLRFPDGKGGFIFSKMSRIPPRTFNDITREDRRELAKTVQNFLVGVLNGKN